MLPLVASSGQGRIRPHVNGGFEFWNQGVEVITSFDKNPSTVTVRHQVQYAAGVEVEAAPKLTLMLDLLGQHILGAGKVGFKTTTFNPPVDGVTLPIESAVTLLEGVAEAHARAGSEVET